MTADRAVASALEALAAAFDELGEPAMLIGGIAVIARGVPRTTLDIDATISAARLDIDRALALLARHGFAPRISDARRFAAAHHVLLLRHDTSGTPLDITLARLPFEMEALGRATLVDFAGPRLLVATVEDILVYKAVAWRERDRSDIERLLLAHKGEVNVDRVRAIVAQFAAALDEPHRVAEFDALVGRTAG